MKTLMAFLLSSVIVFLFTSCTDSNEPNPDDVKLLKKMHSRWQNNKPANYQYEVQILCYCDPLYTGPFNVTINENQLDTVYYLDIEAIEYFYQRDLNDSILNAELLSTFGNDFSELLIDSIYTYLPKSLKSNPHSYRILYDSTHYFPEEFYFDYQKNIADEEFGMRITNFIILQ